MDVENIYFLRNTVTKLLVETIFTAYEDNLCGAKLRRPRQRTEE